MKRIKFRILIMAMFIATSTFYSCKSKTKETTDTPASTTMDTTTAAAPAPVIISNDDVLKKGVADALKDYPKVTADVSDSVINLSGEIKTG